MDDLDLDSGVFEWMVERPGAATLFEELAIDCSCGGKSLRYACQERGIDPDMVLVRLAATRPPDDSAPPERAT